MDFSEIADYYDESCRSTEHSWQAACWFSEEDQYVRFSIVNGIINAPNSSILDVGCGQGDFCTFAQNKNLLYTGIDVSGLMIEKAKQRFPKANFVQWDFLSLPPEEKFDYVLALGSFSIKTNDQYEYIESAIKKCYETCNKAVAITMTVETADVKYDDSQIFYYCPKKIFEIATSLTPYLIVNTASLPCELVLFMFKPGS